MIPARALLVTPCLHGADGVSLLSRQFVRALQSRDFDVEVWALADVDTSNLIDAPCTARRYRANGRIDLVAHGLVSALRGPCDQVIVMHLHLLPAVAGFLARGVPVSVCLHGIECWVPLGSVREALLARAHVITAVSSHTAARFVEANPRFRDRDIVICPPATPEDIRPSDLPAAPSVLVVGRLSREERYKGHDALLDVWPSIVDVVPGASLDFVGDGDDRARLEDRIREEGLTGSVKSQGLLSRGDLRAAYAAARVFALPSSGEGFGIVFLEAMAAGRPCIAGYGGAEDVIDPGRTGLLVPPSDRDALHRALLRLLVDVEQCRSMGRAGQLRAVRFFSLEALTLRLSAALGLPAANVTAEC